MYLAWVGTSATERFLHAFTFHGMISLTTAGDQHLGQARPVRSPQPDAEAVKGSSPFVEQPDGWTTWTKHCPWWAPPSRPSVCASTSSHQPTPPDPDARGPLAEVAYPRPEEPLAEHRLERERGDSCLSSGSRHPRLPFATGTSVPTAIPDGSASRLSSVAGSKRLKAGWPLTPCTRAGVDSGRARSRSQPGGDARP